jgi:co-chaperonin GroES (HSP10)
MKLYSDDELKKQFAKVKGLKPCGHFALVQVLPAEEQSKGGIYLHTDASFKREQGGMDIGVVIAFGNTAFEGFSNCRAPSDWGVNVGDVVELNSRYNHKIPRMAEYNEELKNLRIVSDEEIVAKGVM